MSNKQLLQRLNSTLSTLSTSTVSLTRENLQAIINEIQTKETTREAKRVSRKSSENSAPKG